jgi:hypothetical protein
MKTGYFSILQFAKIALLVFCFLLKNAINAQIFYATVLDDNGGSFIYKINLSTCEICAVTPASPNFNSTEIIFLPNGNHIEIESHIVKQLLPPPSTTIVGQTTTPAYYWLGGALGPSGTVYLCGVEGLGVYNTATNTITYLGNWPSNYASVGDLFYVNDILYGVMDDGMGPLQLIQVNVSDPSQSQIISNFFFGSGTEGGEWNGSQGLFNVEYPTNLLNFYDFATQTTTLICNLPTTMTFYGLSSAPPGLPEYTCACQTNAGTLPNIGPFNVCQNLTASFPAATGVTLDANDVLQYILYSNPANPTGSILATSNTPTFSFNSATMQSNVVYYIASVAGNNLNGNVNLTDPCLDLSNQATLKWLPTPAVAFLPTNNTICPGSCVTINCTFTGTPPFSLTYTSAAGTVTQAFPNNSGSFQVCFPASTPVGSVSVTATSLVDGVCVCQ